VFGRQEQEAEAARVGGKRQHRLHRPHGRAPAGVVAVEAEDDLVGVAHQLLHVVGGAGGAERGHRLVEAELRQRHHVHVALGDQHVAALADRLARLVQAVQLVALDEHWRLGRVQILRLAVVEHPPAEADDLALDVADREHDPIAKTVVAALILAFVEDHQPRFDQQRVVVTCKRARQAVVAGRRVAEAETGRDLAGQTAPLEVVDRLRAGLELLAVVGRGLRLQLRQRELLGARLGGLLALFGAGVFFRDRCADFLRELVHCVDEGHAAGFHQETDRVAVGPAAEAVIELLGRADREAGRFFGVERAQAAVVGAGLLELDAAAHHRDDVGAGEQVLDKALGDHAASLANRPGALTGRLNRPSRCPRGVDRRHRTSRRHVVRSPAGRSSGRVR